MKLSIIIPVRNEEPAIKNIIVQLENQLKNLPYEIIFIDDFSSDNTANIIKEKFKQKINLIFLKIRKKVWGELYRRE